MSPDGSILIHCHALTLSLSSTGSINEPSEQRTEQSVQELVAKLDAGV